jgi:hypothetical protein
VYILNLKTEIIIVVQSNITITTPWSSIKFAEVILERVDLYLEYTCINQP